MKGERQNTCWLGFLLLNLSFRVCKEERGNSEKS